VLAAIPYAKKAVSIWLLAKVKVKNENLNRDKYAQEQTLLIFNAQFLTSFCLIF